MRSPDKDRVPTDEDLGRRGQRGRKVGPPGHTINDASRQTDSLVSCPVCTRIADSLDTLVMQIRRIADHFDQPSSTSPAPRQEVNAQAEGKNVASVLHADESYYTVRDAETYLGGVVKARTLTALFNQHKLKGFRTSRRGKILIAKSSLDSFITEQQTETTKPPEPPIPVPKPKRRHSGEGEKAGFQFLHLPEQGGQG